MNSINVDAAKQQLRQLANAYQRPLRGKFAVLAPLRQEILELERKGASTGEIVSMLAQCQITVSKDTVGRFLRQETKKERTSRAKKMDALAHDEGTERAQSTDAETPAAGSNNRPMLMPRGLTLGNS
jgi:IS30 family transposase